MAIYPIEIDFGLADDRLIDLFIFQWHTPLPGRDHNWAKIDPSVAQNKGELLRNFQNWLVEHFDSTHPVRPLLILAPELSMPICHDSIISQIAEQLRRPAVFIAGIEYLPWADYRQLIEDLPDMPEKSTWLEGGIDSHVVNAAGIWIRETSGSIKTFVQPKRNPYAYEHPTIFPGRNVLLFRSKNQTPGLRLNFCVQVCSDFSSPDFVRILRQDSAAACPSVPLDITFLLQCNKDQEKEQFKQATQAYFEPPINKVETDGGCLIFVNNANKVTGKTRWWGRSKFQFHYQRRWQEIPYSTYSLWDERDHDHQAVILRESGPCLYWLTYKPVYLVPKIAGSGQPGPFPTEALCAVINNNGFDHQDRSNCFRPILPVLHWLTGEWAEGKTELKASLDADEIEQNTANSFLSSYERATNNWLETIGQREGIARHALNIYFECWKEAYFPGKEPEPQRWSHDASKAVKRLLRAYALVKLGSAAFGDGSLTVDVKGVHHASASNEAKVTFMWGANERVPRAMVYKYLAARDLYGIPDLLAQICLLVLVDCEGTPDKAALLADIFKGQTSKITEGSPPQGAPVHLNVPGEVVTGKKPPSLPI